MVTNNSASPLISIVSATMAGTIINDLVESMQTRRDTVVYGDKSEVFNVFRHPTLNSVR